MGVQQRLVSEQCEAADAAATQVCKEALKLTAWGWYKILGISTLGYKYHTGRQQTSVDFIPQTPNVVNF